MVIRSKITIPSLTGKAERTAFVYLPADYWEEDERYPVLYMFDGHNLFTDEEATYGKCWGLEKYLDENRSRVIVAAVECNTRGNGRLSEYSPVDFYYHGERIIGKGKKYMNWLVNAFKPQIDGEYRTLADRAHTYIAGSSMGGLMTVYALAKYNRYFCGGAALSPSLWVGGDKLPDFIAEGNYRRDTVLFTDYGSKEFKNHSEQLKDFGQAFALLAEKGVCVTARIVPGGTHCEACWEKEIPYFMHVLGLD